MNPGGLNLDLFKFFFSLSGRGWLLDTLIIFLAKFLPYLLVLAFLFWMLSRKEWKLRWLIAAEAAMAVIFSRWIITEAIRFFYHSQRPFVALNLIPLIEESSYSFPSGHAAFFFALAMTIFYYNRKLGWWFFAFAAANGLARITSGIHWPLDVLGGAAIGILSGFLIHKLLEPYSRKIIEKNPV